MRLPYALAILVALAGTISPAPAPARAAPPAPNTASQEDDRGFAIKLFRPAGVGEKYRLRLNWSRTEENLFNAFGARSETRVDQRITSVDLAGIVEVVAVSTAGIPTRIRIKVTERAKIGLPDGSTEAVPPGDVITLAWNGKRFDVSAEPGPLSRVAASVLAQGLSPVKHEGSPGATHDDVYGTPSRQRVGAAWDYDRKIVAADLRRVGIAVDPERIKGNAKLLSFNKIRGEPYLKVESNVRADKIDVLTAARGYLPPGMTLVDGNLNLTVTTIVPAIPFKRSTASVESLVVSMTFQGQMGLREEPTTVVRVIRGSRQEEMIELPTESVVDNK
jgi:hypothetical protein